VTDDFASPSSSSGIDLSSLKGALLVVEVLSVEEHVPTVHTPAGEKSPAIRANVSVIDGPRAGDDYIDVLLFPKVLQGQLRTHVGEKVLGRLGQKAPTSPGKNAAWALDQATEEDRAKARAYTAQRTMPSAQPASSAPPF
jgi:hypothetical protein